MTWRLLSSPEADADIDDILAWSGIRFGETAQRRYRMLLRQALVDIAANPKRAGVHDHNDIVRGVLSYHLRHSRRRAAEGGVHKPRHSIYFRLIEPQTVEVIRVLHDAMDTVRHIPGSQSHE